MILMFLAKNAFGAITMNLKWHIRSFHGIKFPLNKAFYIAYLSVHKKDKLTLDELSELVGLRRNTCWKFRQKIAFAIDNYKVKTKVNIISSWEDLIFIVEA